MKTLYININNEQIQSNEELEVLKHDLDSDFFFYLGEKIAKGCYVDNENAIITDFKTQDNEEEYKQIVAQWNEIKTILSSEECNGNFKFTLPNGYIHWLKFHPQYVSVYHRNFSCGEPTVITIDLKELYEDSVEDLQRKILRKLQRDDLHKEIDEIIFNDDAVTRKSPIVRAIMEKYEEIGFKSYKEWLQENEEESHTSPQLCEECKKSHKHYKRIDSFYGKEGIATVYDEGEKYGVIDTKGNEIIPCIYDGLEVDGIYIKFEENDDDVDCSEMSDEEFDKYIEETRRYGWISRDGRIIIPCIYSDGFYDGDTKSFIVKRNGKWGIINEFHLTLVPFIYDYISAFSEGFAVVSKNGRFGYINECGDVCIELKYDEAKPFENNIAVVKKGTTYGYINKIGNTVIDFNFAEADSFYWNHFTSVKKGEKYGLIDKYSKIIIPFSYERIITGKHAAICFITKGCARIYDLKKELFIKGYYNIWRYDDNFTLFTFKNDEGYHGMIDLNGNIIIQSDWWEYLQPYSSEKIIEASKFGKYGYIDYNGEIVIPIIYDHLGIPSKEGLIDVRYKGIDCVINTKNEIVIPNGIDMDTWEQDKKSGYGILNDLNK